MLEIREAQAYARWFSGLRDRRAKARIDTRIRRLSLGNPGDSSQLEQVSLSFVLTTGQATEFISFSADQP